ncbi:MAG: response regulator transcription factor [Lachnospiraceae bacterium]|nr:response regulator transcription factor [Lachnospiraceae bacterium]
MRVLIVEDEKHLAEAVCQILNKNKITTDAVYNGEDGLDYAVTGIYDVIVLDIMLPKLDGISLLKKLRHSGIKTPVILLTSKSETSDKISGLNSGADDYLTKPFDSGELLARIRALGRRMGEVIVDNVISYGDIELNISNMKLSKGDKGIVLTKKEFELMELLIQNKEIILSKNQIIEKLWGFESEAEANHVEVYISFLRKKLGFIGSLVFVNTVRGIGYTLCESGK